MKIVKYRAKIGGLLGMSQSGIKTSGEEAKNEETFKNDLVGGGGDSGTETTV